MDDAGQTNGTNTNTNTNIYYMLFKRSGIPWDFTALVFLRCVIGLGAAFLNGCLFYVALKSRFLYGTCNFLIGFNAFCGAMNTPFLCIGLAIVLTRINFIPIWTCFWLQLTPMVFGNMFICSMFAVAVDRLLSVCCSFWHSRQNKAVYLTGLVFTCVCYVLGVVCMCFLGVQDHQNYFVLCSNPGENYQGDIGNLLFRMNLSIICLTIISYLILWIILRWNKVEVSGSFTQKILKSLLCMVFVITAGYFFSSTTRIIAPYVTLSTGQFAYFAFTSSIFSVLAQGLNAPILYFFSHDYRRAFRKQFPRVFPPVPGSNLAITRIGPLGGVNNGAAATAPAMASSQLQLQTQHRQQQQQQRGAGAMGMGSLKNMMAREGRGNCIEEY